MYFITNKVLNALKGNSYTLLGIILGIMAYIYSRNDDNGYYKIGLSETFEYSLIPVYICAALYSREKISKTLLGAEGGFHIGVFIYDKILQIPNI